jgi:hypothetical protein
MKFTITTFRGDHNCELDDPGVSQMLFEKLVGIREAPLPDEVKTKVPDNFQELEKLWKQGRMGYGGFSVDAEKNMTKLAQFDPNAQEVVMLAPIGGG